MMRSRTERIWLIGGAAGAIVLIALGWFVFISPQHRQAADLRTQANDAQVQVTTLRKHLADLRTRNARLPEYEQRLVQDQAALPTSSDTSSFLRELQAAGEATGVSISGLIVGAPIEVSAAGAKLSALPMTLTAAGAVPNLNAFLDQLQRVQPRAVLINGVTLTGNGQAGQADSLAGTVALTVNLQAFVAQASGATPQPTTTPR